MDKQKGKHGGQGLIESKIACTRGCSLSVATWNLNKSSSFNEFVSDLEGIGLQIACLQETQHIRVPEGGLPHPDWEMYRGPEGKAAVIIKTKTNWSRDVRFSGAVKDVLLFLQDKSP
mmetsp:Transcript_76614/g.173278  ORF Transcript_76614/g.173278 Transcript_76614/m.173278 type:complete len:117 (-) Transcript_76614:1973-2323(-)